MLRPFLRLRSFAPYGCVWNFYATNALRVMRVILPTNAENCQIYIHAYNLQIFMGSRKHHPQSPASPAHL